MRQPSVVTIAVFAVVAVIAAASAAPRVVTPSQSTALTDAEIAAGFTYAPTVTAYDRAAIEAAIASANPAAQALIAKVDGITTIQVGPPADSAAGVASGNLDAFTVTLDLASVSRDLGPRGVSRLVLHELGHVVDHILVPDKLKTQLDAAVPTCLGGAQPGCDDPAERFAETFAKWAMNDIGVNLYIGYAVPPPASLDGWATPLAQLAA